MKDAVRDRFADFASKCAGLNSNLFGEPMKAKRPFGVAGLWIENLSLTIFLIYFAMSRLEIAGAELPLSKSFLHFILMPVFFAACVGVLGLFFDKDRSRAFLMLALLLPELALMGVLDGNF